METYLMRVICQNCGETQDVLIQKGGLRWKYS